MTNSATLIGRTTERNPVNGDWRLLHIYALYRLCLSGSLVTLFLILPYGRSDQWNTDIYPATTYTYLVVTCVQYLAIRVMNADMRMPSLMASITDIVFISLLALTGPTSTYDLSMLLVVVVAASAILLPSNLAYFIAALASLSVLLGDAWKQFGLSQMDSADWPRTGYLGIALFASAFVSTTLAWRLRASEALADRQALDIARLADLNHHIIQRMRTGIMVTDAHDAVLLANEACSILMGTGPIEKRTPLHEVSEELQLAIQQWKKNDLSRSPPFRPFHGGAEVAVNFTRIDGGEGGSTLIFIEDNTRFTQHAQQLKLASLGRLTASIAHEIRNPLGAMSHAAQLLDEEEDLPNTDKRLAQIIQKNCLRINKIVENVLQISRRDPTQTEKLSLSGWLDESVEEYITSRNIAVSIDVAHPNSLCEIRIDRSQMQQALWNLLDNGLRYSMIKTGKPCIHITCGHDEKSAQSFLDVRDEGPGIDESQIDKIFEPFYTSEKSGTGLGLYIARELCEANHARLDCIKVETGACFRITFSHPGKYFPNIP